MDANYVVLIVTLVIWLGLWSFLWKLDTRVKELEKKKI